MSARTLQPSQLLLTPVVAVGLLVVVCNDHWLKQAHPGVVSGKLSDLALLILLPIWLFVLVCALSEKFSIRTPREPLLLVCVLGVGAFFCAMQLTVWGDSVYRNGMGLLRWPARLVWSLLTTGSAVTPRPVQATPDPSDLICLPALLVAWQLGKKTFRVSSSRRRSSEVPSSLLAILFSLVMVLPVRAARANEAEPGEPSSAPVGQSPPVAQSPAVAQETPQAAELPRTPERGGFFMRASPVLGPHLLWSEGNAAVGFTEPPPSSTTAWGGGIDLEWGGGITQRIVLSGALGLRAYTGVRVHANGGTASLEGLFWHQLMIAPAVTFLPWPGSGWSFGLRVGYTGLSNSSSFPTETGGPVLPSGRDLRGPFFSLAGGKEWHLAGQWWAGVGGRVDLLFLSDGPSTGTTILLPSLTGTLTLY